jgi:protein ImuA
MAAPHHPLVCPDALPHVWRALELGQGESRTLPSGHALLDSHLPGGGWPVGSLVEILQAEPGRHAWQLLLPVLAQGVQAQAGPVVLVQTPYPPFGPGLAAQGLPAERLLSVSAPQAAARLWATEQALRCADVLAVLAWLPQARSPELQRLHLAAHQHDKLLFVFRQERVRDQASPARLRLLLQGTHEVQHMQVHILKRRGPPLLCPLTLPACPPRLSALLHTRRLRTAALAPIALPGNMHVLDRTAAHA